MPAAPIDDVFLTGYSLRAPSSNNPREFYEHLRDGKDMTTPTRRYPKGYLGLPPRTGTLPCLSRFDQDFFKFSTKQTEKMDVAIRLLLEVTHEALMDAQLPVEQVQNSSRLPLASCFSFQTELHSQ
jgi:acyl transferase domain-containing protein